MKVKDAVKALLELDQEAELIIQSPNVELCGNAVKISSFTPYEQGSKKVQSFRDFFDNTRYNEEVWFFSGGNLPVVYIR